MYKNQLQELAQRSCFSLPSYACIRKGPDHSPRFKASVNFNGEIFQSPTYSTTLRQAEHASAEVALNSLSARGPSKSLTARVLDETGVYKNLLQETAHRAGFKLPSYTTIRSGPGHVPVFTSTVELAGMTFTGDSAKTKKQAEKNAAIAAWSTLKTMPNQQHETVLSLECRDNDESRVIRRRYQNQPSKGRMQRPHNCNQQRSWKLRDSGRQKRKSFLSLLPPPQPRTMSKILPSNLSKTSSTPSPALLPKMKKNPMDVESWTFYTVTCSTGFAPAVQIRSVIPVCAAPPVMVRPAEATPARWGEVEAATLSMRKMKL